MDMKKLKLIIFALSLIVGLGLMAQTQNSFYTMRHTPLSYSLNPSNTPSAKAYLNFPVISGIGLELSTSGFAYKDIINQHPIYEDSLQIDLEGFYNKLHNNNHLRFNSDFAILALGFKAGKNYISLGLDLHADLSLSFSKDLIGVLVYGSALNNGHVKIMDNRLVEANVYMAPSITYSREVNDKLRVGLRAKMPLGIANINTVRSELGVDLSDGLELKGDFLIRSSNILGRLVMPGLTSDFEFIQDINVMELLKNKGLALDLGGSYKIRDDMEVSLAILDLGYINWTSNVTDIVSKNPGQSFTIEPIDIGNISDIDSNLGEQLQDSILNALDLEARDGVSYRSTLPTRLIASYSWNFGKIHSLNAVYMGRFANNYTENQLTMTYGLELERYINISFGNTFIMASNNFNSFFNPSAALNLNLYFLNLYIGGGLRSSANVAELTGFNLYAGLNFAFGYTNNWKKKDIPEDSNSMLEAEEVIEATEAIEEGETITKEVIEEIEEEEILEEEETLEEVLD